MFTPFASAIKTRFSSAPKSLKALLIGIGLAAIVLVFQPFRSKIPLEYKEVVKNLVLQNFFPGVQHQISTLSNSNVQLNAQIAKLKLTLSTANISVKSRKRPVEFLGKVITLLTLDIPLITDYYDSEQKPTVFAEHHGESFYLASGDGLFWILRFDKNLSEGIFIPIPSNFRNITSELIVKAGRFSIKDILVHNNSLLVSYTHQVREGCFNTSILSAKLSDEYLDFQAFYTYDECLDIKDYNFNPHEAGGKLSQAWNGGILFSVGDYNNLSKAQDTNSQFGKIFYISNDVKVEMMSLGNRNPQGIVFSQAHGVIVTTEHGPAGGDEVNLFTLDEPKPINFGWPLSSYGEHYGYRKGRDAPLYKSHKAHGFREPLIYFTSSIGISRVIECVKLCDTQEKIFIFGSMNHNSEAGRRSVNAIQLSEDFKQAMLIESLRLDERVRDLRNFEKGMLITTEGSGIPQVLLLIDERANYASQ